MSGLWLASYLVLWGIVVAMCLFLIGILRQLGMMHRQLESGLAQSQEGGPIPALANDGPVIGSPLVDLKGDTINGFGSLTAAMQRDHGATLLVFMSPMCETCQHIVKPLNTLVADIERAVHPIVIMRADEQGCRAFLSVFPLRMPF